MSAGRIATQATRRMKNGRSSHRFCPAPTGWVVPGKVDLRDVWDAIGYIAASGCTWSLLPKDFPPVSTVRYYFYRWRDDGLLAEINRELVAMARGSEGRSSQPSAGVIDSQSVKTTENTSLSDYDAGKRIKGRKRHIMTDTCGHLIALRVHPANVQDRDGAPRVFARLRREAPKLRPSSRMAAMPGQNCATLWSASGVGLSRSSSVPIQRKASRSCPAAGSSNAPSPGSENAADWQRTGRKPSQVPKPGSSSRTSDALPDASQDHEIIHSFLNRTLRAIPLHVEAYPEFTR